VHHVPALSCDTAQSEGMRRFVAISGASVSAAKLSMGETHVAPQAPFHPAEFVQRIGRGEPDSLG
jgi:uncharacterized RmlC-like cupin family protein